MPYAWACALCSSSVASLLASPARARRSQAKPPALDAPRGSPAVDDEPMSHDRAVAPSDGLDTGTRPRGAVVARRVTHEMPRRTRRCSIERPRVATIPPPRARQGRRAGLGRAIEELAARQMRKSSARDRRLPRRRGAPPRRSVGTLDSDDHRRRAQGHPRRRSPTTVHDTELDACLVKAAATWTFSLADAQFTWPVVSPPPRNVVPAQAFSAKHP